MAKAVVLQSREASYIETLRKCEIAIILPGELVTMCTLVATSGIDK